MVGCVKREELVSWEEVPEGVKLLTFYFSYFPTHIISTVRSCTYSELVFW